MNFRFILLPAIVKLDYWEKLLSNKTPCVVVEHCQSTFRNVVSGVPQGFVLGPILLLLLFIYITDNDSVCCGDLHVQLCANDAKLYFTSDVDNSFLFKTL